MKVVHLSYKDDQEGAAIAVDRLCEALSKSSIESRILVQKKVSSKQYTTLFSNSSWGKFLSYLRIGLDMLASKIICNSKDVYFSFPFFGKNIDDHNLVQSADIIHVHWINRGFQSLSSLEKLTKLGKPVILTLHDSWYVTGGCHMVGGCIQFKYGCAQCPFVRFNWLTNYFLRKKKNIFSKSNVHFIAPSMWSKIVAQGSHVTYGKEISVIPNCIDSDVFKPVPEITAKLLFNLPVNKNIILINITNDLRKGVTYTRKVIERMLSTCDDVAFVGFGTDTLTGSVFEGLPINLVGRINDKYSMVMLYNASSVLLSPTMEEPFGQTFIESMSVGTPCVAFNHSGPKDIISHKLDGYLAKFGDVDDLVDGLNYCLSEKKSLAYNCRKKIINEFSYLSVSNKIKHFYNLVCGNNDY